MELRSHLESSPINLYRGIKFYGESRGQPTVEVNISAWNNGTKTNGLGWSTLRLWTVLFEKSLIIQKITNIGCLFPKETEKEKKRKSYMAC